ncbi:class I SAM-dependent methyltransferase [Rheinheimera sp.]|uniref:class I SAM-dependent methyltransferase n=1 Tax=Rheinheimera sp. TaxID=1869214 RepID=UPI0027B8EB51|nr:class I SAM-dependent methyltransferase [Rheinheimera sp.]
MSKTLDIYHQGAALFARQYDALSFDRVHTSWQPYWPDNGMVLDIGAGSGRDALWLAERGCQVIAVEPAADLRHIGQLKTGAAANTTENSLATVQWLNDSLPELKACYQLNLQFNTILLSAVWMHLALSERERAFRKIANLLAPGGRFVLSLRFGEFTDGRVSYPVSVDEIATLAKQFGLVLSHVSALTADSAGRTDVQWQTLVLVLPDDGSASLSKIRHIVLNDSKSSTYKLALLRTLVRIADAHPGAVLDRQDGKVVISLGLVALYWIRLFKRLVDNNIQQNSDPAKGLGFVTERGWLALKHLTADDFAVGMLFTGTDAAALQQLFSDTLKTIKEGPVTYIWQRQKDNRLFQMQRDKTTKREMVLLDRAFLESYGRFELSESMWDCFRLYGCWIEPLLVQQWVSEMQKYEFNRQQGLTLDTYHHHLRWLDRQHDTGLVRKKVETLRSQGHDVRSVWSGKPLYSYDIDHCLPFSYWPNNDLWNLLPSSREENRVKSDRLPSKTRLHTSREQITDWWQQAWQSQSERQRFFVEAAMSLPNVAYNCTDFEVVFEALQFQSAGIQQRLQIGVW